MRGFDPRGHVSGCMCGCGGPQCTGQRAAACGGQTFFFLWEHVTEPSPRAQAEPAWRMLRVNPQGVTTGLAAAAVQSAPPVAAEKPGILTAASYAEGWVCDGRQRDEGGGECGGPPVFGSPSTLLFPIVPPVLAATASALTAFVPVEDAGKWGICTGGIGGSGNGSRSPQLDHSGCTLAVPAGCRGGCSSNSRTSTTATTTAVALHRRSLARQAGTAAVVAAAAGAAAASAAASPAAACASAAASPAAAGLGEGERGGGGEPSPAASPQPKAVDAAAAAAAGAAVKEETEAATTSRPCLSTS